VRLFEAVEFATRGRVIVQQHRLLAPVCNVPPAEAAANRYTTEQGLAMLTSLKYPPTNPARFRSGEQRVSGIERKAISLHSNR
jgi:hypothetical protein